MATLSTVVPGANVAVMVAHDEPGTSAQHKATEPQPYEFVLGAGVGLGNFLVSVIGAEVTVSMHDGSTLTGQVLLVEEAQHAVPVAPRSARRASSSRCTRTSSSSATRARWCVWRWRPCAQCRCLILGRRCALF